ncbi:hypothetical protein ACWD11_34745 [Streptomyces sp. NPDC002776]
MAEPRRPWKTLSEVELATAEWIDWYCHRRLHGEIGHIKRHAEGAAQVVVWILPGGLWFRGSSWSRIQRVPSTRFSNDLLAMVVGELGVAKAGVERAFARKVAAERP